MMQSHGTDLNELDRSEESYFDSIWRLEKEKVARTVPKYIRYRIIEIADAIPYLGNPSKLVDKISWRIYTEACMNPKEKVNVKKYDNKPLTEFIEQETNHALKRADKRGLLKLQPYAHNPKNEVTLKVLEGLVTRSIELFNDWGGADAPEGDERNLRINLESYIRF